MINKRTGQHTQQGTGQHRGCNQKPLLAGIQVQVMGNRNSQRPKKDPHHERDIEVKERRQKSTRVSSLEESFVHVIASSLHPAA
ncbi:hypothetical protein KRIGEM_03350 [Komagataeibacter rhaeticus]|nr:hypothetical protein KRIGEM_03350 [Komagataeibacter rhaeticus]